MYHSVHSPIRLGGELEFWNFGGGQNISDFSGGGGGEGGKGGEGLSYEGVIGLSYEGGYSVRGGQFILHPFSHFEMQHFKISKNLACGTLIFNINIFRFQTDAGLQEDIDLNNESKFSFSKSSFFSPLSGHPKPTKPMKLLLFYPFGEIRGPSKSSSQ